MKDRKTRMKNRMQIKAVSKYIREHLDELIDNDTNMRLQTLNLILEARTMRKSFTSSTSSLC
jgi:hypothetical protein